MSVAVRAAVALTAALLSACAHYPVNPQLPKAEPAYGYRFGTTTPTGANDENFIIVTMSGGGTRAAALAYGVLQKLDATQIPSGSMLDAIDVVSSVSGGSFTSSYYALHGRDGFDEFKTDFLEYNIQGALFKAAANPLNWPKLLSPRYSRVDLAADLYDKLLFKGATYAQMPKEGRPYTILNATEMDIGSQFTFVQEQFDTICSDLNQVKVARAAAASSAFPGLLVPMTFRNYAGKCGYTPGTWYTTATHDFFTNPRRYKYRADLAALMQPDRPYLHLMDGGIADNIGARNALHAIASSDTLQMDDTKPVIGYSVQRLVNLRRVKRIAVIMVNAKTENELKLDKVEKTPGLVAVISNISNTPLANYSFDTTSLMKAELTQMRNDAKAAREAGMTDFPFTDTYTIEITFGAIPDPKTRAEFNAIGTNFSLSKEEVQKLIDMSGTLLDQNPEFQRLLKDLK